MLAPAPFSWSGRNVDRGEVDGWLPAATLELKDDDLSDIAAAMRATGAGPASPSPA